MTETDQPTRRALRLNYVRSDGRPNTEPLTLIVRDPVTGDAMVNAKTGAPEVFIRLRPMSDEERKAIVESKTESRRDPQSGRGLFEFTDSTAVTNEVLRRTVTSWEGIIGADDQPLVCTPDTAVLLDSFLKAQITRKLFNAEAVEVSAESFR